VPHPILIEAFHTIPHFEALTSSLPRRAEAVVVDGLAGASPMVLLAALHRARPERLWVVIASGPDEAEHAAADLEGVLGEGATSLYPQRESLPYEAAETHVEVGGLRVEALEALLAGRASILVTTARAIQELSPAVEALDELQISLRPGESMRPADLASRLDEMGFSRVGTVEEVGQYALRGGILDVFGFGSPEPGRVEFWGDEIDTIRHFDVLSQLSVGTLDELRILPVDVRFAPPATGASADGGEAPRRSLLGYLPPEATLVHLEGTDAPAEWQRTWSEVERLHAAETMVGHKPEAPDRLFLQPDRVAETIAGFPRLYVGGPGAPRSAPRVSFGALAPEPVDRDMPRLGAILSHGRDAGERTLILCDNEGQLERLQELLEELGVRERVTLAIGSLTGGFLLADADPPLRVLTDHEIFRRTRRLRRKRQFRGGVALESFAALNPGNTWSTWITGSAASRGWSRCGSVRRCSRRW
jgi:transcription-repair coupling factor (superfamily II helicase)